MQPFVAFNGDLWMSSQTSSYSSPDGLDWTKHDKTDTGSRIWETTVFFNNYLWTFGGMEYASRTVQNEIWRSADGMTWENVGTAAWSPRKSPAVVVYQGKLWLFGGSTHVANDFTSSGLVNDVWTSARRRDLDAGDRRRDLARHGPPGCHRVRECAVPDGWRWPRGRLALDGRQELDSADGGSSVEVPPRVCSDRL